MVWAYFDSLPRDVEKIACNCNGIMILDENYTKEELKGHYNCGKSYPCCIRAFVCDSCKLRILMKADAPPA